jgi:hypothetical protein
MILEMILCFIMSYPSLHGSQYTENANKFATEVILRTKPDFVGDIYYNTNDLLLCIMILFRLFFFTRMAINLSAHKESRA